MRAYTKSAYYNTDRQTDPNGKKTNIVFVVV